MAGFPVRGLNILHAEKDVSVSFLNICFKVNTTC